LGSAAELAYLVTLSAALGCIAPASSGQLEEDSTKVVKQMQALVAEMDARLAVKNAAEDPRRKTKDRRPPWRSPPITLASGSPSGCC
jgi:hypothetical protein